MKWLSYMLIVSLSFKISLHFHMNVVLLYGLISLIIELLNTLKLLCFSRECCHL
uniref:Uncharacterized protein n=1 Tax=Oryza brachyantha TaxID=4533 RepID=J3L0K8_ORYBR